MTSPAHIVDQWLQTDAAFGVEEVPLRLAGAAPASVTRSEPQVRPAPQPQLAAARQAPRPATQPASPALIPSKIENQKLKIPVATPQAGLMSGSATATPPSRGKVPMPPPPPGDIPDLPPITRGQKEEALEALRQELEAASQPYMSDIATRVVFGEGDPDASLLFVGEGPGAEEDRLGRPFVGRSGQLLDKMIAALKMRRDATGGIFIGNVVKLRCAEWDPNHTRLTDRPPTPEEAARGLPFLHRQIEIIRPKVIVTLGAPAVKYLTGTTQGVMSIRGTWLSYRGIPVMPTYHPAFVLRAYTEENRRKVWSDLQAAQKKIAGG